MLDRESVEAARRAVELDPTDADAHAVLGEGLGYVGEAAEAEAALDLAVTLNPSSADILARYAGWAPLFGKPEHGAGADCWRCSSEPPALVTLSPTIDGLVRGALSDLPIRALYLRVVQPGRNYLVLVRVRCSARRLPTSALLAADELRGSIVSAVASRYPTGYPST